MQDSLLEQRTFGFGDRAEGVLDLHRHDDFQIIPGFFGLLGRFHLCEIHVANDAAVRAQASAMNECILDWQLAHLGHRLGGLFGVGGLVGLVFLLLCVVFVGLVLGR